MAGSTIADARITVTSASSGFSSRTFSGNKGRFELNIELAGDGDTYTLEIVPPTGKAATKTIHVEIDETPPEIHFDEEIPPAVKKPLIRISGRVKDALFLDMNGVSIPLENGAFSRNIELVPGNNRIRFEARDQVFNTTAVEKRIVLDKTGPVLAEHSVSIKNASGGEKALITLYARDESALARAAKYEVAIGGYSFRGILIKSGGHGKYTGKFRIPENVSGKVRLVHLRLSDYLGNASEYEF